MASRPASRAGASKDARASKKTTTTARTGRPSGSKQPDAALLKRLVARVPDIVFRYRLKPRPGYDYISPSVERVTGYAPREYYADPNLDIKTVHPDDRDALMDAVQRPANAPLRLRWIHREGRTLWIEVLAAPIKNRAGAIVGFEGVGRDITGRVEAEERAEEAQAFVSALMKAAGDPIVVIDSDLRVVACNEAFATSYEKEPHDLTGKLVKDIWRPEFAKRRLKHIRRVFRTGRRVRVEEETLLNRHFDAVLEPIMGGQGEVTCVAVIAREISQRKRAEQRLRESEERYRLLYQDNPSMYFTVSTRGKVLSVNSFGAQQLGYEPGELEGRNVLDVFHSDDREAVAMQIKRCIADPNEVHHWEFRKQRKDGETIWVRETARATTGPDGSTILLIVCEDITERRRMEEELQQAREELERKVEQKLEKENPYDLTFRQLTVLHLVVQGKSDREIGLALGISPLTVNTHVSRALRKMGASSRTEAGVRALREGLIQ